MKKYFHIIHDQRVAQLTLQFCQMFGAEECRLEFDEHYLDFLLVYSAPAKFNVAVDQFINATNSIKDRI